MKLIYKGHYAIAAVLCLVLNFEKASSISSTDIFRHQGVFFLYLQLLSNPCKKELVSVGCGLGKKCLLDKKKDYIAVNEVINVIDGSDNAFSCKDKRIYQNSDQYLIHAIWRNPSGLLTNFSSSITLASLINNQKLLAYHVVMVTIKALQYLSAKCH